MNSGPESRRERFHNRDYRRDFLKYKAALIRAAAMAKRHGISHREPPFQVGAAAMSIEPGLPDGEYAVYTGYNFTPTPVKRRGRDKRCAERNVFEAALEKGATLIPAMVTVASEKHTGDKTRAHDALHPCQDCRDMMRELRDKGILPGDGIICSVNDSKEISSGKFAEEQMSVDELLALYDDMDAEQPKLDFGANF
ncbi:MAG: hypothetical protein HYV13_00630 [Candidatus Doudnabacteria bacterium]|nr:hypothetical protein [Candidatus Doudnabacteria bacterium]